MEGAIDTAPRRKPHRPRAQTSPRAGSCRRAIPDRKQRRAVVSHQVIERILRLARPPQPGMDVSQRAAQDRTSRIFGDEVGDPGLDLLEGSTTTRYGARDSALRSMLNVLRSTWMSPAT